MEVKPGKAYTHDVLGNRLTRVDGGSPVTGGHNYTWDILNRMTQYAKGTPGSWTQYTYRADGLRVLKSKHVGGGHLEQTHYRYDGQMGTEDLVTTGPSGAQVIESVTRYGLGARGIDVISRTTSSGTTLAYPIYDAHGNNVGLISRNGANYAVSQERSYDAWGAIRAGIKDTTKLTYCANLGHKEDDESGLIYMRARYYEPGSGRFIGEDSARDGWNWFAYCNNDGVNLADPSGKTSESDRQQFLGGLLKLVGFFLITGGFSLEIANFPAAVMQMLECAGDYRAIMGLTDHLLVDGNKSTKWQQFRDQVRFLFGAFQYKENFNAVRSVAGGAFLAIIGYGLYLQGELWQMEAE